jgi:thiamine biosynthesis lipoprotein
LSYTRYEHRFSAMGGPCLLLLDDTDGRFVPTLLAAVEAEVARLEQTYSRYRPDSLVSKINRGAGSGEPVPIDAETLGLLRFADTLWQQSDGAFDLTSGILRRAWDFRSGRLPDGGQLAALLPLIGWQQVQWSQEQVYLPSAGMELDFGGLVKEYAVDAVARLLREHGIRHALFDMAGDLVTIGAQGSGAGWPIGIRHPRQSSRAVGHLSQENMALASSGDYERGMTIDGQRYSHMLDPRSGWPVAGLVCASVQADQCLLAGSVATTALLKPEAAGLDWLDTVGLSWLAVDRELAVHGPLAAGPA